MTLYLALRLAKMIAVGVFFFGAMAATLPDAAARRRQVLPWLLVGFLGTLLAGLAMLVVTHRTPLSTWVLGSLVLSIATLLSAMAASAPDTPIRAKHPRRRLFWRAAVPLGLLAITTLMVLRPP